MKWIEMVDLTDLTNDLTMKHGGKRENSTIKARIFYQWMRWMRECSENGLYQT
jgi:hypothetical protein